jgi:hypothetical protein
MGEERGERIIRDEPVTEAGAVWQGYGTALKPAYEPVILARKPLAGRLPENLLQHGVGALNVHGARVQDGDDERWPANLILDESAGDLLNEQAASTSRFFYCPKPSTAEKRAGVTHPLRHDTVKPLALMRYLARLVTPPSETVLDPFSGSGTTGIACLCERTNAVLIERDEQHAQIGRERLAHHKTLVPTRKRTR